MKMEDKLFKMLETIKDDIYKTLVRPDIDRWPREVINELYRKTFDVHALTIDWLYEELFNLFMHKRLTSSIISIYDIIEHFTPEDSFEVEIKTQPSILKRICYDISSDAAMFKLMEHIESYSIVYKFEPPVFSNSNPTYQTTKMRFAFPYNFILLRNDRKKLNNYIPKKMYLNEEEKNNET